MSGVASDTRCTAFDTGCDTTKSFIYIVLNFVTALYRYHYLKRVSSWMQGHP